MEQMEVDVTLSRIKVKPPRLILWFDEPRLEPLTDEDKEIEKRHIEANEQYMNALTDIYGDKIEVKQYLGIEWVHQKWFSERYQLTLSLGWDDFRRWTRQLVAEAYAMHLGIERDKKNAETKTP